MYAFEEDGTNAIISDPCGSVFCKTRGLKISFSKVKIPFSLSCTNNFSLLMPMKVHSFGAL